MPALCSFAFGKAWIEGQESAFKKYKKEALGMEGNTTVFSMLNCHKGLTFTIITYFNFWCENKFEDNELCIMWM